MNIPMAYDVLPQDGSNQGPVVVHTHGSRNSHYAATTTGAGGAGVYTNSTNTTVAGSDGVSNPLLMSEQEQMWQSEMAEQGIGHLPVSWYRQTPQQAIWSLYGVLNRVICGLVNFGANVGIGYAILHKNDEVGLWQEPNLGDNPYKSAAFSDLLITCFLITFITTALSTGGIRKAMKDGQTIPVDIEALEVGWWVYTPVRMLGTCTRSLMLGLWSVLVVGLPMVILLEIICASGGMNGETSQCSMAVHPYIYIKATFSFVVAWVIYPLVLLCTINTKTLPPLELTFFYENQKQRWDEQQRKANGTEPPPL